MQDYMEFNLIYINLMNLGILKIPGIRRENLWKSGNFLKKNRLHAQEI